MHIIVNPTSGHGIGRKCLTAISNYLAGRNISFTVHETYTRGHGKRLAEELTREGSRTIVAMGGDGTFHEVLNGMDFSHGRLGLIPTGRGNDFAQGTAGLHGDPVQAIAAIARGEPDEFDYIQIGTHRCLNVAGTGMDVDVLELTEKYKNSLTYTMSLVKSLLSYQPYTVSVTANGETKKYDCIMAGVCNGSQFGGGIKLCPAANPRDGKLEVVIMAQPKPLPALCVMPSFVRGRHLGKWYTTHFSCECVTIETPQKIELDGEIYDEYRINAAVVPNGVKTFKKLQ